jgi:hypothetical protein
VLLPVLFQHLSDQWLGNIRTDPPQVFHQIGLEQLVRRPLGFRGWIWLWLVLVLHVVVLPTEALTTAAKQAMRNPSESIDRLVRTLAAETFNKEQVVAKLIDYIKALIGTPEPAAVSAPEETSADATEPPPASKGRMGCLFASLSPEMSRCDTGASSAQ